VCVRSDDEAGFCSLLRDPLIRLVMDSDGVTEQAMIALVEQVRWSLAARERQMSMDCVAVPTEEPPPGPRTAPSISSEDHG
jgi:hypothetical protein